MKAWVSSHGPKPVRDRVFDLAAAVGPCIGPSVLLSFAPQTWASLTVGPGYYVVAPMALVPPVVVCMVCAT